MANAALTDLAIQHAIHLLRFGNGVEQKIIKLLDSVQADLVAKIAARLSTIEERGIDLGPSTTARLKLLIDEVSQVLGPVYGQLYDTLVEQLHGLATTEADFQTRAINTALTVKLATALPSPQLLASIATERPIMGTLLKPIVKDMEAGALSRIQREINIGMVEGEGVDKIVRRIMGTKAGGYRDGVANVSRNSARSIVRTAINHTANHAAQETWRANQNVVKGWEFVATLDSRTTIICASLDGSVYPVGEGPIPPRHIRCRSISVASTKSFKEMGLDLKEVTPQQRASIDGQVKPQTFDAWLKKQPPERQLEVLGKTRADLWRRGKLSLQDFIRNDSEVITLDELKKLHPSAFN
ncbi:minor capsid protein [Sphingomonas sp. AR_OL41]|uniref:minor capsid protein n=1 Tax=Sphingomonas sp. AR_OL41 TaxID=3042729 RepID=UPI00248013E8|nr:minor capsid protein [Sphingomonas sp. AR_OL41]MDH7971047.1 minor capsid protein [Sphingomonas sp. AR_OL41]